VALTGAIVNADALQIAATCAGIAGAGFTTTITVKFEPTHAPAAPDVGVTVYVAV